MHPSTAAWLADNVRPYSSAQRVTADIDAALDRVPSLRLKADVFIYDDGRSQLLLCLHGLLPILYRNATYNIPIALWLPYNYPHSPPMAFVVPTASMLVRPSKHLDPSGKSTLPYILDWTRKPEACSLVPLLEALQQAFSVEPPLYTKPPEPAVAPVSTPVPIPASSPVRPPLPPKPPQNHPQIPSHLHPIPSAFQNHPPQPPVPVHVPVPVPAPAPVQPPLVAAPTPAPPNFLEQDIPPSSPSQIITAPPPPRPPNPELLRLHAQVHSKLSSELASLSQALETDAVRLRGQQSTLLTGEPAVRDEMARLEAVRDVCRSVSSRISHSIQQAETSLSQLRAKGDPEVDELVCSTSIVHNQLINLVAEDNAIEDTIYHLHRALNMGRIDLERFLRTTRVLAEDQFMKRALIEKIQIGLALGTKATNAHTTTNTTATIPMASSSTSTF